MRELSSAKTELQTAKNLFDPVKSSTNHELSLAAIEGSSQIDKMINMLNQIS